MCGSSYPNTSQGCIALAPAHLKGDIMREIKFRAWDKENKKWFDFCSDESDLELVFQDGSWVITHTFDEDGSHPIYYEDDDFILLQYTGLKDKNRKKIYEGDILTETDFCKYPVPDVIIVKYKGSGFWAWDIKMKAFNGDVDGWVNYDTEIIGNIYENPELLKEEQ